MNNNFVKNIALFFTLLLFATLPANANASFKNGVVVSKNEIASQIGAQMLKKGGNAIDAAVATGYALGVVEPNGSGIGGGGFALIYIAKTKEIKAIDFRERAPEKINTYPYDFISGPKAVGVPGSVAGFEYLRTHYGVLSRQEILKPVIGIAKNGFPVNNSLVGAINKRQDILRQYPSGAQIFLPDDKVPVNGQILKQPDLARSLKEISKKGSDEFYTGKLASLIVDGIQQNGGFLSLKDLKKYKVYELAPVCGTYKGKKVCSFPPPSSGGVCILEGLNILNNIDMKGLAYNSPERLHYVIEALKFSFADRAVSLGDPRFNNINTDLLLSNAYAKKIADRIKSTPMATPSNQIQPVKPGKIRPAKFLTYNNVTNEKLETTNLTVVDKDGNIAVITISLNGPLGSAFVAPKTGIMMNDTLDDFSQPAVKANMFGLIGNSKNYPQPYKTPLSSMSPTIVFGSDNLPVLAVGSPGGPTIISAVFNTLLAYLDYNMPVDKAVSEGRVHHQWEPDHVYAESTLIDEATKQALISRYGYVFPDKKDAVWAKFYWNVEAASLDWKNHLIQGASDPRAEQGLVYEK